MDIKDYKKDARGNLVPLANIKEIDLLKDELVVDLTKRAKKIHKQLAEFKKDAMKSVHDFIELSASEYGVKCGGNKGNVSLLSFDGSAKAQVSISNNLVFDEKIHAAKKLIDECLDSWSEGASENLRMVVNGVFRVNQSGRLDKDRILGLRSYKIEDPKWKKAMHIIEESITVSTTKAYIRFYELFEDETEKMITLDIAAV